MLYGQFVGDWRTRTTAYLADGTQEHTEWDVRFSWVLEGRAVQDLWITPPARGGAGTGVARHRQSLQHHAPGL